MKNIVLNFNLKYLDFKKVLVEFDDVIESASFFAIDSEFTGLNTERTSPFNSPSEFYKKICAGTEDYIIIQLGITAFRLSNGKFLFNLYLTTTPSFTLC